MDRSPSMKVGVIGSHAIKIEGINEILPKKKVSFSPSTSRVSMEDEEEEEEVNEHKRNKENTKTPKPAVVHMNNNTSSVSERFSRSSFVNHHIWRSCCFTCDREVVQYVTKTIFSATILCFCLFMIGTNKDPCNGLLNWYTGLVGLIAGSYIEQGSAKMRQPPRD